MQLHFQPVYFLPTSIHRLIELLNLQINATHTNIILISGAFQSTDELYKSRIVIRGDFQKEGIDYGETFSPVAKLDSIRLFIALTILWELKPMQADAALAFVQAP